MGTSVTEDKLVISKANDVIYLADKRHSACFYGFLNEHEAQVIKDNIYLTDNCIFWGGYNGAKRVMFGANCFDYSVFPFLCVKFTYKKEYKLTHRDFLGALMATGIERSTIGDIVIYDGYALVFVKTEMFEYIKAEISKIGRVGVDITIYDGAIEYSEDFDVLEFTVSSYRLDVFVSALCHLSREKSQEIIKADLVSVNHNVVDNVSKNLKVGDIITIRKYGKFEFTGEDGFSKKGRARVSVNHFR